MRQIYCIIVKLMNTQALAKQVNLLTTLIQALQTEKEALKQQNQRLHGQLALLSQDYSRLDEDSFILRHKNQELHNHLIAINQQLINIEEVQKILIEKQNELAFYRTQNKKSEGIIASNKDTIHQLSLKIQDLQKMMQIKTQQSTQRIKVLENNRIQQIKLQDLSKKIEELTSHIARRQTQIQEWEANFKKQTQTLEKERIVLNKRIQNLVYKHAQVITANQRYSQTVLNLQNEITEYKSLLEKEKTVSAELQSKYKVLQGKVNKETIFASKLQQTHKSIQELQIQNSELSIKIERLSAQKRQFEKLIKQRKDEIVEKNMQIDILERNLAENQSLINQKQLQNHEISCQVEKLRKSKADLQTQLLECLQTIQQNKKRYQQESNNASKRHQDQIRRVTSQSQNSKESLQRKIEEVRNQNLQLISQSKRKEDVLKQKLQALQKEVNRLQNEIHSTKLSTMVEGQTKNQKDIEIAALRKVIIQQEKYITDQKIATERLFQLVSSKEKEIENLQTSNSMLRKQVMNVLANEDSTRKEMLMQKQKQISMKRIRGIDSNRQLSRQGSGDLFRKRYTAVSQTKDSTLFGSAELRRSQQNINGPSTLKMKQSMVQKISIPSQQSDQPQI